MIEEEASVFFCVWLKATEYIEAHSLAYIKEEDDESSIRPSEFGKQCAYFSGSFGFKQGTKKQIVGL